jgi:hypothetical protein
MMKGRNGFHLWNDATRLAIDTRKTIRKMRREFEARADGCGSPPPWFFDPFVPDLVTVTGSPHTEDLHDVPWEDVPTKVLQAEQQCWRTRSRACTRNRTRTAKYACGPTSYANSVNRGSFGKYECRTDRMRAAGQVPDRP